MKGEITLEHLADRGIELYDANARCDPIEVALETFEKSAQCQLAQACCADHDRHNGFAPVMTLLGA